MKYVHDKHTDRVFYISNGWSGNAYTIRQYIGNVPGSKLQVTEQELKSFKDRLKENGWYEYANDR
jgi:hypothetical protein